MAKRRKENDEEEEMDFKLPKFDEEKFLKKERRNIKTTFLSFLFGLLIASISFGFWTLLSGNDFRWELMLLFGVFSAAWIKYLFLRLNIDLTEFGRKGWFTTYAIYFFTWLLILIVLVNPPFYDDEAPYVEAIVLPDMQELGGTIEFVAKITDNAGIMQDDISFAINGEQIDDFTFDGKIFSYTFINPENTIGEFPFTLTVTDTSGHLAMINSSFTYSNETIRLPTPLGATTPPGPRVTYADTIKFDVSPQVSRVYYTINGGEPINATKNGNFYETTPEYEGWIRNANVTLRAYAEMSFYFVEPLALPSQATSAVAYNNTILDAQTYYFNVSDDASIGTKKSETVDMPGPQFYQVPGFEVAALIISLLAVVFLVKYRKKHRRT
ncbi:MAG: hypothetical protein JW771_05830 [Candidatus Thermoplasmatota archaeon]|nr:hypothetical protein [Candidatus Thermoplasmatota archaeon]